MEDAVGQKISSKGDDYIVLPSKQWVASQNDKENGIYWWRLDFSPARSNESLLLGQSWVWELMDRKSACRFGDYIVYSCSISMPKALSFLGKNSSMES